MVRQLSNSSKLLFDNIKNITAFISTVLSALAVYIVTKYLSYATTKYKTLLIILTIMAAINDLYLQKFLDPVILFPLPCFYVDGVLDFYFHVNAVVSLGIWVSFITSIGIPYILCTLYRNQILLPDNHRFRMSKSFLIAFVSIMSFSFVAQGPLLMFAIENSAPQAQNISDHWLFIIKIRWTCISPKNLMSILGELTFVLGVGTSFQIMGCYHTLHTLKRIKILSDKTRGYHRKLTIALILQMVIPCTTIILPGLGFVIMYVMNFDDPEISPSLIQIMGMHAIVHSLTVILSTDFIRSFLRKEVKIANATTTLKN